MIKRRRFSPSVAELEPRVAPSNAGGPDLGIPPAGGPPPDTWVLPDTSAQPYDWAMEPPGAEPAPMPF